MLLCIKNIRNLFSNTNDNKNSASTLSSYPGALLWCLFTQVFETVHHSHPLVQQQLFRSRDSSLNLIGRCFHFAQLKRFVRLVRLFFFLAFSVRECFAVYVEASIEIYCFILACHH